MRRASRGRLIVGFLILFGLYQSAEGVGALLLHSAAVQALLMIAMVLAAWPVGRWLGYRGYDAYGLDLKAASGRLVVAGLLLAGLARLAAAFWGLGEGVYTLGAPPSSSIGLALIGAIAGAAVSTFVPSIAEDILTRGFWLKASGVRWNGPAFILATSAIYVLNHLFRLGEGPLEWMRLFCFGLAYACAAWRWRNLWAAVGLHWGWNLTNALLDTFVTLDAIRPGATPWLSSGAHLAMAALVLLWPTPRAQA
ncbi:CPBP family intramembrane glutamic endopeptidase [Caulobacter sp.]|uniref:CPBP family intramembrane glutamic endopeptidase n=1 Tax=Caulobacter sp. TaxID=78 RepID=UPI003BABD18E